MGSAGSMAHAGHDRGERRGMDAKHRGRSCDRHQPRACAKRAARGSTARRCCTGPPERTTA